MNLELPGFELMEMVVEPTTRTEKHSHERAHFCIALRGECTEFDQAGAYEYHPLTLGFLPPDRCHYLTYGEIDLSWFCMEVKSDGLEKLREYSKVPLEPVRSKSGVLNELFLRLYTEFRRPDNVSELAIEGLALEMLAQVARETARRDSRPAKWLVQARDFLDANYNHQFKLDSIAETVGIHPIHLAREFRRHFRYSVGEYVRARRVEYVCLQLTTSDAPLADIAIAAGFSDQSHLSRIFKRALGTTPSEYRKYARV